MLAAHILVGCQHDDLVDGQPAVDPLGTLEIMQELQNVYMHDQRFPAAGGTHERQFVQLVRRI